MFQEFVQNKIDREIEIVNGLDEITKEQLIKSSLSDFTKNYFLNEFDAHSGRDELAEQITKSNKLYFNYAIRPKWTLQTFLFRNFESRPPNDIFNKLNYFPFYKFYSDSIRNFINESSPIFVTRSELIRIIDNTNNTIYDKLTNEISNIKIKNFFLQIFLLKYDSEVNYNLESSVPLSFIKIFLEDKSYHQFIDKFTAKVVSDDDSEISLMDIIKILTDKYSTSVKEEIIVPVTSEKNTDISVKEIRNEDVIPEKTISENVKPIEIILDTEEKTIYSEELSRASQNEKSKIISDDEISAGKANNIKNLFDDKLSEKILGRIYNSDLLKRERSFEKLSSYRSWIEASGYLKELFLINDVDIYNKDIIKFVNILNDHFKKLE